MRHAAAVAFAALALSSCADDGSSVAGPGGAAAGASGGVGGSAGSAGGSAGSAGGSAGSGGGSAGAAGVSGTCVESTPSLGRVGPTFEVPTLAETAPKRNPDIAHDSVHDVYLLVTGAEVISGTFLDPDGQSLAPPFAIAQTTEYTQTPRVAYGAGKLLVAWHDNRGSIMPELRARLVSWDGSAPDLQAPDFFVGAPSYQEMGPAMAYSETSELFLVVWHSTPDDDLRARRIDTTGALIGAEIQITNDPDWQSGAAAAWNSVRDEFLVTYTHAGSDGAAVRSQRIRASDGSFVGGEIELGTAAGTWTTQAAYLPCEDRYLVGWVADGALGLRVSAIGEADGAPFAFPSGYGYPDGFALTYHPATNTLATVMHGQTNENYGVAILASGEQSAVLEATESTGDVGHFNPRITANRLRNEWLMVTSRGFQTIVAQRLGP